MRQAERVFTREERHRQALDVIERREKHGRPFILYLRDFQAGARSIHAQHHEKQVFTIDNRLLDQVQPKLDVVFIQSEAEELAWRDRPQHELAPKGPSLQLTHDTWRPFAQRMIQLADVIFVDAPILGEGTRFELNECLAKLHQTVVILAAPDFMRWRQDEQHRQEDDADELVQRFPRVIWSDDLYQDVAHNPVVRDLIERASAIGRAARPDRGMPVTFAGVLDHYLQVSTMRLGTRQPWHENPWEDNWERTFWGFHRAVMTTHAMFELGAIDPAYGARVLVECYRTMVNLLGENLINDRGMVMRGHIDLSGILSHLALQWAQRGGDARQIKLCTEMVVEVAHRTALINDRPMPYAPILKSLYFPDLSRSVTCAAEDAAQF